MNITYATYCDCSIRVIGEGLSSMPIKLFISDVSVYLLVSLIVLVSWYLAYKRSPLFVLIVPAVICAWGVYHLLLVNTFNACGCYNYQGFLFNLHKAISYLPDILIFSTIPYTLILFFVSRKNKNIAKNEVSN